MYTVLPDSSGQDLEKSVISRSISMDNVEEHASSDIIYSKRGVKKQKGVLNTDECERAGCPEGIMESGKCDNWEARRGYLDVCREGGCVPGSGLHWSQTVWNERKARGNCTCPEEMEYDWIEQKCKSMNCAELGGPNGNCFRCAPGFEHDPFRDDIRDFRHFGNGIPLRTCRVANCLEIDIRAKHKCEKCKPGFTVDYLSRCWEHEGSCKNGYGLKGIDCLDPSEELCGKCEDGFHLVGDRCKPNECTCSEGVGAKGVACHVQGAEECASCKSGFWLQKKEGASKCIMCEENIRNKDRCNDCGFYWALGVHEEIYGTGICKKPITAPAQAETTSCEEFCEYFARSGYCQNYHGRIEKCKLCTWSGSTQVFGRDKDGSFDLIMRSRMEEKIEVVTLSWLKENYNGYIVHPNSSHEQFLDR